MKKKLLGILLAVSLTATVGLLPVTGASAAASKYATPATEEDFAEGGKVRTIGMSAQIINGSLYVWGLNGNGRLGITSTINPDGNVQAVNLNDVVPWPTEMPKDVFGGSDVVSIYSDWGISHVVTADGNLYSWGINSGYLADLNGDTAIRPTPVRNTYFPDHNLEVLKVSAQESIQIVVKAKDRTTGEIGWYTWGTNSYGECFTGTAGLLKVPTKIDPNIIAGETIKDIQCGWQANAIVTEQGNVYTIGANFLGQLGNNFGQDLSLDLNPEDYSTANRPNSLTPVKVTFGEAGTKIVEVTSSVRGIIARDDKGGVWSWGGNARWATGVPGTPRGDSWSDQRYVVPKPVKIFGADSVASETYLKKAAKLVGLGEGGVIIATDNTIHYFGEQNFTRFNHDASPNMIFEEVSKKETIIGFQDDYGGITALTKSGDSYFAGSNINGGAGTGTSSSDVTTPDNPAVQEPETLPPVKPMTKNKVYLDVVFTDIGTENPAVETGADGSWQTANVNAGQKFTVKVYFEDFAKLHQFTLPIKFSTDTGGNAKVVRKSGSSDEEYTAYTADDAEPLDGSNVVKFGTNSGIQSNVRDSVWPGGQLVENEQYPRVNNESGYVSVKGATTTENAPIVGKQLMYSIDFIGTTTGKVTFQIMDAQMTKEKGDPVLAAENLGANWQVVRRLQSNGDLDLESVFEFNDDYQTYFPNVSVTVIALKSIDLLLRFEKDGEKYNVEDKNEELKSGSTTEKRTYYTVDKSSENTYMVLANPTPKNASDASIDSWNIQFDDFTGKNPTDKTVSDYIQVIQTGAKSYTFKMAETTNTSVDGYFVITATKNGKVMNTTYLKVSSMRPPEKITIINKDEIPEKFLVRDDKYAAEPLKLVNSVPMRALVKDFDVDPTGNLNVTWTAYHCVTQDDGTVTETIIANNDLTAPAVIKNPGSETIDGVVYQTANLVAQRTTPDGSYVKVKAVSTAGDTVYDEITVRVELLTTDIITDGQIYIGKVTSRPLNISTEPYDAYKPEYEYSVADDSPAALSDHGSYITVSANGTISAGNEFYEGNDDVYDEVIIREKKSDGYFSLLDGGNTATVKRVKVYVKNILPPPDMDVEAQNNVGVLNDKVLIRADLQVGDKLKIYKEYGKADSLAATYDALTATQIAELKTNGYIFIDESNSSNNGLSGTGGTIGYLVERSGENFTEVPVSYTAEPCILTGYVRLEGKVANSPQNRDITVEIQGLRDASGNPIAPKKVTDETGYFEFENYIPNGTYTVKFSRDLYITRYVTVKVTGTSDNPDIAVSTLDNPIYLAPGDLGNPKNGKLDPAEYQSYLYNWIGKVGTRNKDPRFDDYNFAEPTSDDNVIGVYDLSLMIRYYNRTDVYKDWMVTQ